MVAEGKEQHESPKQISEEDIDKLLEMVPADDVPAELAIPEQIQHVEKSDLVCGGCLWTGRLIRATLTEKMPRAPRDKQQRYDM